MAKILKTRLSKTTEPSFRAAFAKNKKDGKKQFRWNNKNYTTQTASEKALNLTSSQLKSVVNKSYEKAKGSKSKSQWEISESYTREHQFRIGDRIKAMGLDMNNHKDQRKSNIRGAAFGLDRKNYKKK